MKTCKDCTYWKFHHRLVDEDEISGRCHLHPTIIPTADYHWCGQLKEKMVYKANWDTPEYWKANEAANKRASERLNIWKQQQDLKQPDEIFYGGKRGGSMKDASRKLNQELLRQYKKSVAEIEELLK